MNTLTRTPKNALLESPLPTHLVDIVQLAKLQLGWEKRESTAQLFAFFLRNMIAENYNQTTVSRLLNDGLIKGRAQKSIKLESSLVVSLVARFKAQTKINNTSDIVRLIILRIYEDLLKRKDEEVINELQSSEGGNDTLFLA